MRISISIGSAYYNGEEWDSLVDYTMAADRMGVNEAWSAEAWGMDAIVPLAYLAAKTENIRLGTGIMQVSARVPSMIAMTAQSLDTVSEGPYHGGSACTKRGQRHPQTQRGFRGTVLKSAHRSDPFSTPCPPWSSSVPDGLMDHVHRAQCRRRRRLWAPTVERRRGFLSIPIRSRVMCQNSRCPTVWDSASTRLQCRLR